MPQARLSTLCLRREPTCFKKPNNPSCIDLFLINTIRSFQETQVFETGLSDFHKLVVTPLKSNFPKSPPKKKNNNDNNNNNNNDNNNNVQKL